MTYQPFNLAVTYLDDTMGPRYHIQVTQSPCGRASQIITLHHQPHELDHHLRAAGVQIKKVADIPQDPMTPEEVGTLLFEYLFQGQVGQKFNQCIDAGHLLRIGLFIEEDPSPQLLDFYNMPWEFMFLPKDKLPLAVKSEYQFVRYLVQKAPTTGRTISPPKTIRVLVVMINPQSMADHLTQIDPNPFLEDIEQALGIQSHVDVKTIAGNTLVDLGNAIDEFSPHVLHLIAHGGDYGDYSFLFIDRQDGGGCAAPATITAVLQRGLPHLRLVNLLSCELGVMNPDVYGSFAQLLCRQGIPMVLAMRYQVSLKAAGAFTRAFFSKLNLDSPIDKVVQAARGGMYMEQNSYDQPNMECGTPVFYSTHHDFQMFVIPSPIHLNSRTHSPTVDEKELLVDLKDYFYQRGEDGDGLKPEYDWRRDILPKLEEIKAKAQQDQPLQIRGWAHQSLWFALGYTMNATTGIRLFGKQRNEETGVTETWRSDDRHPNFKAIAFPTEGPADAMDMVVTFNVFNNTESSTLAYLEQTNINDYKHLRITSPYQENGIPIIPGGPEAAAFAFSVGRLIKAERNRNRLPETIHLFYGGPTILAMFIGMYLNACGPIQIYEYHRPPNGPATYKKSFLLT